MRKVNVDQFKDYAIEKVPAWALNYLTNSDPSSLIEQDVHPLEEWAYPAFGLGTEAYTCLFVRN